MIKPQPLAPLKSAHCHFDLAAYIQYFHSQW